MPICCLHADAEILSDLLVSVTFSDQLEDLSFAVGEGLPGGLGFDRFSTIQIPLDDLLGNAGADILLARQHMIQSRHQLLMSCILEDVTIGGEGGVKV